MSSSMDRIQRFNKAIILAPKMAIAFIIISVIMLSASLKSMMNENITGQSRLD